MREYAEEKLRIKGAKIDNDGLIALLSKTYRFNISVNSRRLYKNGTGPCIGSVIAELHTFGFGHYISAGSVRSINNDVTNFNQTVIEVVRTFIAEFK